MKKITLNALLVSVIALFSIQLSAQNTYTYTLIDNGAYNFTIAAVADVGGTNFPTEVQSYGFTILLPDGATMTIQSSLGPAPTINPIPSGTVTALDPAITGHHASLVTETLGATVNLPNLPATGLPNMIATIQVNGAPTVGELRIVANNSVLDDATGNALEVYLVADTENNDTFLPVVASASATGLSGTTFFDFSLLGINDHRLDGVEVYPNPAKEFVTIKGISNLKSIELVNITGKRVKYNENTSEHIDISNLESGVYFMKITTVNGFAIKKIVKQ